MVRVGLYEVHGIDKTGNRCTIVCDVVSRIAPAEELQQDPHFQKKAIKYLRLKEKPYKFAINFKREIKAL